MHGPICGSLYSFIFQKRITFFIFREIPKHFKNKYWFYKWVNVYKTPAKINWLYIWDMTKYNCEKSGIFLSTITVIVLFLEIHVISKDWRYSLFLYWSDNSEQLFTHTSSDQGKKWNCTKSKMKKTYMLFLIHKT